MIIAVHSRHSKWDIELLKREFEEEHEWTQREGVRSGRERQKWRRRGLQTWMITEGAVIYDDMKSFCHQASPPGRSEMMAYLPDSGKTFVQTYRKSSFISDRWIQLEPLRLDLSPDNPLDLLAVDAMLSRSIPDLWLPWKDLPAENIDEFQG